MDPGLLIFVALGGIALLAGFIGSLLPLLPGPPLTALGNLIIQVGLTTSASASGLSWGLCLTSVILGILMTVADFLAPNIVANLGGSGKTSGRYATLGVVIACVMSCTGGGPLTVATAGLGAIPSLFVGVGLIFFAAYLGGRIGELKELSADEPNRIERAHKAGLSHMVGLGFSMVAKVAYAGIGVALAIAQILLA